MASGWGAVGGGAWNGNQNAGWNTGTNNEESAGGQQQYVPPAEPAPVPSQAPAKGAFGASSGAFAPSASFNNSASASGGNSAALQVKEEQLKKREAQLAAREKQLQEYEKKLTEAGHLKPKNWPFPFWRILHHDISGEVPEKLRRPVREGYVLYISLVVLLLYNFFCASVMLGSQDAARVSSWFLSLLYTVCGIPLGFYLWYWKLYNGAKSDSTFTFISFFFWFAVHTAFCIYAAIAPPIGWGKWSFSGFIAAFQAFDWGNFQGVIYLVGGGAWSALALFSFWLIRDVYYFFRGQGGAKQVQQDAALAVFRNQMQAGNSNNTSRV